MSEAQRPHPHHGPSPRVRVARALPRRTVLRGAGVALALPWLAAMAPAARGSLGLDAPSATRRRMVYVYSPNGVQRGAWKPAPGPLETLSPTLEPLAPFAQRLAVLGGLESDKANANGDGPGDHARAVAAFLTGVQPLKADGQVRIGRSADQVVADHLDGSTPIRSIQVGAEGTRLSGHCDSGYACAYSSHMAWRSPTTPAHKENSPRRLFDRLFRGGDERLSEAQRARRKSVLDFVRGDAKRLARDLGGADRDRVDQFLTGLRELEERIERAAQLGTLVDDEQRPDGPPEGFDQRVEQLFELVALAFEVDATRVATMMIANEGSNRAYPEVEVTEGHHGLSHHKGDAAKIEQLARIERHHVSHLATFLGTLTAKADGEGDLLASTAVVYGSGLGDGNAHDHFDLPIIAAGDVGSFAIPGQCTEPTEQRPLNDLHLAMMARMGAELESFGDSGSRLLPA